MQKTILILSLLSFLFLITRLGFADEVADLKKQIEELQARVNQLEAVQKQSAASPMSPDDPSFWDPFAEMDRMKAQMNQMFQQSLHSPQSPSQGIFSSNITYETQLNMEETPDAYIIKFDMKGLNKDKVNIDIDQNSITVSGEYSSEEKQTNPNSFIQSKSFGSFLKTIPIPVDADTSKVKTEKEGDTLVIHLPKKK